ncbi:hypothetical protein EV138_3071 [Kribbella voronezhensis]|uniref:Uncharacterized protein n=1 Tax=Kribbella voronezhensis TaxID=2512212 RepID=A0A4R7TBS0_9ACTN|nr:hypothetical protein [Kribbella voronezhensis]TDU89501.1 hypothetical protein EV138_3071 [Kribbella voronezhensis]
MNDNDLRDLLQADPDELTPLDAAQVIAGARRRRRTRGVVAAGVASAAVAVVAAGSLFAATDQGGREPSALPLAGTPSSPAGTPSSTPPTMSGPSVSAPHGSGFAFQNEPQAVGQLPANGSVPIAPYYRFQTRGTQWAVISQLPGEPQYEPFGWRATVGNSNLGDGTDPGIQSAGAGAGLLVNSVFKGPRVTTVLYTSGKNAWYAKVYRLGGISGWVQSSAVIAAPATPTTITAGTRVTPAPPVGDDVSVFAYDATGRLLASFGSGKDPLAK